MPPSTVLRVAAPAVVLATALPVVLASAAAPGVRPAAAPGPMSRPAGPQPVPMDQDLLAAKAGRAAGLLLAAEASDAPLAEAIPASLARPVVFSGGAAPAVPSAVMAAYQMAVSRLQRQDPGCHLTWPLLAAIGDIESGQAVSGGSARPGWNGIADPPIYGPALDGTHDTARIPDTDGGLLDGDVAWDRAVGPMQFLPSTWAAFGTDADGDGVANPQDIRDAALTAGRYLCAGGLDMADPVQRAEAVLSYNQADWYVSAVLATAAGYAAAAAGDTQPAVVHMAIGFAYAHLGDPYLWGGTGPLYDCSGLTQAAYAAAGVTLPRTAEEQWQRVPHVSKDQLAPGDLVFFEPGEFRPGLPGHVGIYLGNGAIIDDPHTGTVVRIARLDQMGPLFGVARPALLAIPGSGTPGFSPPTAPPAGSSAPSAASAPSGSSAPPSPPSRQAASSSPAPSSPPARSSPPAPVQPGSGPGAGAGPGSGSGHPGTPGHPTSPGHGGSPGHGASPGHPSPPPTPGSPESPGSSPGSPNPSPGSPGNPGTSSTPGSPSTSGTPGTPGTPGTSGTPGMPGRSGIPGTPGMPGTPGTPSIPGTSGDSGEPGSPGASSGPGASTPPSMAAWWLALGSTGSPLSLVHAPRGAHVGAGSATVQRGTSTAATTVVLGDSPTATALRAPAAIGSLLRLHTPAGTTTYRITRIPPKHGASAPGDLVLEIVSASGAELDLVAVPVG